MNKLFSIPSRMDAKRQVIYERIRKRMKELRMPWPSGLAKLLNELPQTVNNWRTRGIPASKYEPIARELGWTVDQLLGTKPPDDAGGWPFPSIPSERIRKLTPADRMRVQAAMMDELDRIDATKSPPGRHQRFPRSARG